MVRAVEATGKVLVGAMVAEWRRQLRRVLPIDGNDAIPGTHDFERARGMRRNQDPAENGCEDTRHESVI
jgi:hypothetical protein